MKEYNIKLNFVIEAEESDYDRVEQYAQELVEAILQDDDITYDEDILVVDASVDEVKNLSGYDSYDDSVVEEDEDELD